MSARTTRSSQRLGRAVVDPAVSGNQPSSSGISLPVQATNHDEQQISAPASPKVVIDIDPNRRFNPDVLLTIAECLTDIKYHTSVINLSCVSRYFADSLKPFRERMGKRAVLKLSDLDVEAKSGWGAVKWVPGSDLEGCLERQLIHITGLSSANARACIPFLATFQ